MEGGWEGGLIQMQMQMTREIARETRMISRRRRTRMMEDTTWMRTLMLSMTRQPKLQRGEKGKHTN